MYKKILIATDGSPTAGRAAARGAELAKDLGSELILLNVADPASSAGVVEEAAKQLGVGLQVATRTIPGDPADVILTVSETEDVDLIVVGNKGMAGTRFLLGNVPNKVSHHAPCTVLIVKTT